MSEHSHHQSEGGSPELKQHKAAYGFDPERQRRTADEIARGIQEALHEQRTIDHRTARRIAEQLYGPGSPLQHFAMTGEVLMDQEDGSEESSPDMADELWSLVPVLPDQQAWLEAMASYTLGREDDPGPVRGWRQLTASPEHDAESAPSPTVYVVSVADYQRGQHHGVWLEADQDPEELQEAIWRLLADSPIPGASRWAIHDWEGFGELDPAAFADLAEVSAVALGIAEHGQPFAAYIKAFGSSQEVCDQFGARFLGRWHSAQDYARHWAEDLGWQEHLRTLPEWMRGYVMLDVDKLTTHLESQLSFVDAPRGRVYVLRPE